MMGIWIEDLSSCATECGMSGKGNDCWHVLNGMLVVMFEASWPAMNTTSTLKYRDVWTEQERDPEDVNCGLRRQWHVDTVAQDGAWGT